MLAIALGATLLAWLVGGIASSIATRDSAARMRDESLRQLAHAVLAFSEHELAEMSFGLQEGQLDGGVHVEPRTALDLRYCYQVWKVGGGMLMRSAAAPRELALVPSHTAGFSDGLLQARPIRIYVQRADSSPLEIQVAELLDDRRDPWSLLGLGVLSMLLLSLLSVGLMAGWAVMRALRPVTRVESLLRERRTFDHQPLPLDDAPRELRPVLEAMNQLLRRVADRVSQERGFTALAAHELRTPLASLRLQAQVAVREPDPQRRDVQLAAVMASVDRCTHLLEQLLTLARVEQGDAATVRTELDLAELLDQVLDDMAPEIERRQVQLQLALSAPSLHGRSFAVQTLLRNLLANALAHSPLGGVIRVSSQREGDSLLLAIDDAGPGVAAADRERVFERFVRLDGSGSPGGVGVGLGLGLSIVRSVVEGHGADIELVDSPLGGLGVRIRFPLAPGPGDSRDRAP
jgi:two-component system sensor histidine kinase QseC